MTNNTLRLCALLIAGSFAVACASEDVSGSSIPTARGESAASSPSASKKSGASTSTDSAATTATETTTTGSAVPDRAATATTPGDTKTNTAAPTPAIAAPKPTVACANDSDSVTESYELALLRAPDTAGFQFWLGQLQAETQTRLDVLTNIVRSDEFAKLHAGFSDPQYVTSLYTGFLGREPDADGFNFWVGQLGGGASRADVAVGFVQSAEFADKTLNPAYACYF